MIASHKPKVAGPDPRLYAALMALTEPLTGEILNGHLIVSPRPATPHAHAMQRLGLALGSQFDSGFGAGPGGWIFLAEPELHLGEDVLSPDLAGWRTEHLPELPDAPFLTVAPDWVCEGISASTEVYDRGEKVPTYASHGVKHLWLVDPWAKTLEVFRSEKGTLRPVATHKGSVKVKAEPFQAAELDLALLWLPSVKAPAKRKKKPRT